jgi:thiamine biosynthesis protein ThiS
MTAPVTATIDIMVNGEPLGIASGLTVNDLLAELGLDPRKVVVEHNREILQRDRLADVKLRPGDVLELVHFVGGG